MIFAFKPQNRQFSISNQKDINSEFFDLIINYQLSILNCFAGSIYQTSETCKVMNN